MGVRWHDERSLYQLETADGRPVTLHELDCVEIASRPRDRSLTLTFADASSNVPALWMRFEGIRMQHWTSDEPPGPAEHAGQVSGLDWDGSRRFALYLLDDVLSFTATRVTVSTQHPG